MNEAWLGFFLFLAIIGFLVWRIVSRSRRSVVVFDYERGLRFINGQLKDIVGAGHYRWFGDSQAISKVDTRIQSTTLHGQEVLTSDKATLRVTVTAQFQVVDVQTALMRYENYHDTLYANLQIAVREVIGNATIDQLLEQRAQFDQQIFELAQPKVAPLGLELVSLNVRDIMLPGALKNTFTQILEARQQGLAALERARGEQAALRNLANAARVLENNPMLYQLRLLQVLDESKGHSIVLHLDGNNQSITQADSTT